MIKGITELKNIYLRIKDYEFEGGSAPKELYEDFTSRIRQCEYEDELIGVKRNQILNNFETVSSDLFVKYFGQRGRTAVYDVDQLGEIVKKSALRANDLKQSLRDLPKQMITDENIDEWMKQMAKERSKIPNEPLVLVSRKNGENLQDKSMIVTGIRKNIEQYGIKDGLKVSNAALIPQSLLNNTNN